MEDPVTVYWEKVIQSQTGESKIYFLAMSASPERYFFFCLGSNISEPLFWENGILVGQEGLKYICLV